MPDRASGFEHQDVLHKDDARLRREAHDHLAATPGAQIVAELFHRLRALKVAWWGPDALRKVWPASVRMHWYRSRPDLRQSITTGLTGLAPKAARQKDPEFQAQLIDSVLEAGDIEVEKFELAFDPTDLAVYGPPAELWRRFQERMPWRDEDQQNLDLIAWLLRALLAEKSSLDGLTRKPVLSAWDVRTHIDGTLWHTRMPLEVRVEIDEARLRLEKSKPNEPFHAKDDLTIAVPELIAAKIPLEHLAGVFRAAERALGFASGVDGPLPSRSVDGPVPSRSVDGPVPSRSVDGVPEARSSRPDAAHGASVQRPKAGEAREQSTSLRAADAPIASAPSTAPSLTERRGDPTAKASPRAVSEHPPRATPSAPPTSARPSQPSTLPGAGTRASSPPAAPSSSGVPRAPLSPAPVSGLRSPAPLAPVAPSPAGPTRPSAIEAPATDEGSPVITVEEGTTGDDMEQTNPWIVPSDDELMVDDGSDGKLDGSKDAAPTVKRRRPQK